MLKKKTPPTARFLLPWWEKVRMRGDLMTFPLKGEGAGKVRGKISGDVVAWLNLYLRIRNLLYQRRYSAQSDAGLNMPLFVKRGWGDLLPLVKESLAKLITGIKNGNIKSWSSRGKIIRAPSS